MLTIWVMFRLLQLLIIRMMFRLCVVDIVDTDKMGLPHAIRVSLTAYRVCLSIFVYQALFSGLWLCGLALVTPCHVHYRPLS